MSRIKSLMSKFLVSFSCRYVYNSSVKYSSCANEVAVHKNTWKKWFHESSSFKPVVPSITFADSVKNNVFMSQKGKSKNCPLVAVQGRSQQRKPPELVKEVSGKTQITHLKRPGEDRLVKNSMNNHPPDNLLQCFNKFDHCLILLKNVMTVWKM